MYVPTNFILLYSCAGEGDSRFRRWEYWGYESMFALHYTGDHTVYQAFGHRNSKNQTRPFIMYVCMYVLIYVCMYVHAWMIV